MIKGLLDVFFNLITYLLDFLPAADFSVVILPSKIPNAINNIDIGIDIKIVYITFILKVKPKNIATTKNKTFCKITIGKTASV